MKTLPPINDFNFKEIESIIVSLLKEELFVPLVSELNIPEKKVLNSLLSPLALAVSSNRVYYWGGAFRGKFTAEISKELRGLGAKFKDGAWYLAKENIPLDVLQAHLLSEISMKATLDRMNKQLSVISPEKIADKLKLTEVFQTQLWKMDEDFKKNVKSISIPAQFSETHAKLMADKHAETCKLKIKSIAEDKVDEIRKKIWDTYFSGNRYESVIDSIQKVLKSEYRSVKNRAEFIARTETKLIATSFRQTRYMDAGLPEYVWTTVHDSRVRSKHKDLDGKVFRWDTPPASGTKGEKQHPGEPYNCFLGDTEVFSPIFQKELIRREYVGDLTILSLNNNRPITCTPNHPIFTGRGWLPAKDVQIGDEVIEVSNKKISVREKYPDYRYATFEEQFSFFSTLFGINTTTSAYEFHDNFSIDKDIEIITPHRLLREHIIPQMDKRMLEHFLAETSKTGGGDIFSSFTRNGHFLSLFPCMLSTPINFISFFSELFSILFGGLVHSNKHCLAAISCLNSFADKIFMDRSSWNHKLITQCLDRNPREIQFYRFLFWEVLCVVCDSFMVDWLVPQASHMGGEVISRDSLLDSNFIKIDPFEVQGNTITHKGIIKNFSGHVYNLHNSNNWYFANKLLAHNCRCFARPVIR